MGNDVFQCLTIRQPWAWAVVSGAKDIENRSWTTDYRGPIVIQAGATMAEVNRIVRAAGPSLPALTFSYGTLVGIVDLVDVLPLSEHLETSPWAWGPYCWRLANPRQFAEPIPAKGKLKLFPLAADLSPRIRAAIGSARVVQRDATALAWVKIMTDPETADARHEGLFDSYLALADAPGLMRLAQQAITQRGDSEAFVERAAALAIAEKWDAALADASNAIELDPLNARAFSIRGRIYEALSMRKLAISDRRRSKELNEVMEDDS